MVTFYILLNTEYKRHRLAIDRIHPPCGSISDGTAEEEVEFEGTGGCDMSATARAPPAWQGDITSFLSSRLLHTLWRWPMCESLNAVGQPCPADYISLETTKWILIARVHFRRISICRSSHSSHGMRSVDV